MRPRNIHDLPETETNQVFEKHDREADDADGRWSCGADLQDPYGAAWTIGLFENLWVAKMEQEVDLNRINCR